jgi:hypothetical protein
MLIRFIECSERGVIKEEREISKGVPVIYQDVVPTGARLMGGA